MDELVQRYLRLTISIIGQYVISISAIRFVAAFLNVQVSAPCDI